MDRFDEENLKRKWIAEDQAWLERNSERRDDENFADPNCPGCGGGDKVPHGKYFRCPVCDSEWQEETEDQPTHPTQEPHP